MRRDAAPGGVVSLAVVQSACTDNLQCRWDLKSVDSRMKSEKEK